MAKYSVFFKYHFWRKCFVLFLLGQLSFVSVEGQNCFTELADFSGFDTSPYQSELESAACELIEAFPAEFQDDFRVYDFGFYPHNENLNGSFQNIWNNIIQEVENQSQFYLIFGKESDNEGNYNKFWIDLKLPTSGFFGCIEDLSPGYKSSILAKLKTTLAVKYAEHNESPFYYAQTEVEVMNGLKDIIINIINCCDPNSTTNSCNLCLFSFPEIIQYFELNDFTKYPVSVLQENKVETFDCSNTTVSLLEGDEKTSENSTSSIISYVTYPIVIEDNTVLLEELIASTIPDEEIGDFNIYIMDIENMMDNSFYEAINNIKNAKGGLIYLIDNFSAESSIYISPTSFDLNLHLEQEYLQDLQADIISSNSCDDCPDWMKDIWEDDFDSYEESSLMYMAPALPLAAADGPIPVVDAILAAVATAAITYDLTQRVYITYIAHNPLLNQHYCGRSSGFKTPDDILKSRLKYHHAVTLGYSTNVDKAIQTYPVGYWAIRGREQQNIDFYGGAISDSNRRTGATCVNAIRGVSKINPFGYLYHWSSSIAWGEKYDYTGYGISDIDELWEKIKSIQRIKKYFGQ